ncbi:hypothetical protein SUDANB105_06369 [Streptomyces sp. enrichment culture]|uniref:hypothetical protein n=1 Tax=Streptomyces sp. enrichment culture TaxID=1795815 RepID=UPI003F575988
MPAGVTGLDFALTALFTVLALDAVRDRLHDLTTPALALISALATWFLFPGQLLLAAFALFTAGLPAQRRTTDRKPSHV